MILLTRCLSEDNNVMKVKTIAGGIADAHPDARPTDVVLLEAKGEMIRTTNYNAAVYDFNSMDEWEFPDGSRLTVGQGFLMADPHWKGTP